MYMVGTGAARLGPVGSGPDVTRWGVGYEVNIRNFWLVVWLTGPVPHPFAPSVEGNRPSALLPTPPPSSLLPLDLGGIALGAWKTFFYPVR